MRRITMACTLAASLLFLGCGGGDEETKAQTQSVSEAALGEMLFHDTNLSLHRNMACASCHDPEHGFVDARFHADVDNDPTHGALSIGSDGVSLGGRNAPTAAYAQAAPDFGLYKGVYRGGQFHDGRALNLKAQAKGPFLDTAEMMMPSMQDVIERVKENSEYVSIMKNLYGETIFDDTNVSNTYDKVAQAIAKYEKTQEFAPFDSKYDRFLACKSEGKGEGTCYVEGNWSIEEQAGYALFFSEGNTNCASCHTLSSGSEAASGELFTNYKFENIGTPRNLQALMARDGNTTKRDRGLGGFLNDTAHDGKIKVPTLRNIAVTAPYMSNGVFAELRTVLEFYDHMIGQGGHPTNPETSQPWGEADFNATINHTLLQDSSTLTDTKIRNLEAFLRTLTDARYEHLLEPLEP